MLKNIEKTKNKLLKNFFNKEENLSLLKKFLINSDKKDWDCLENNFSEYYKKVIIISYFSKSIYFTAQNFDKVKNHYINKNILYEYDLDNIKHQEDISKNLEEIISDYKLYNAFEKLDPNQKKILNFLYVNKLNLKEIGQLFNISAQAVYKRKQKALNKIRENIL